MSAALQMLMLAVALDTLGILTFKKWLARIRDSRSKTIMAWTILLAAGLVEIAWLVLLKNSNGFERTWNGAFSITLSWVSFFMLAYSLKFIPAGTAYAVWTGFGAAGGAIAGMLMFGESRSLVRIASIALIVVGIVGVRMADTASD